VLGEFKNIPKKIRDSLAEEQKDERINIMVVLNLNLSLCHLKRGKPLEAIKHAKDAIELNPQECKAHYRLAQAFKANNDLDQAQEAFKEAIKIQPDNHQIRKEYKELTELKSSKERQWYSKMSGFLGSDKLKKIEQKDEQEEKLKYKIKRKCLNRPREEEEEEDFQAIVES